MKHLYDICQSHLETTTSNDGRQQWMPPCTEERTQENSTFRPLTAGGIRQSIFVLVQTSLGGGQLMITGNLQSTLRASLVCCFCVCFFDFFLFWSVRIYFVFLLILFVQQKSLNVLSREAFWPSHTWWDSLAFCSELCCWSLSMPQFCKDPRPKAAREEPAKEPVIKQSWCNVMSHDVMVSFHVRLCVVLPETGIVAWAAWMRLDTLVCTCFQLNLLHRAHEVCKTMNCSEWPTFCTFPY